MWISASSLACLHQALFYHGYQEKPPRYSSTSGEASISQLNLYSPSPKDEREKHNTAKANRENEDREDEERENEEREAQHCSFTETERMKIEKTKKEMHNTVKLNQEDEEREATSSPGHLNREYEEREAQHRQATSRRRRKRSITLPTLSTDHQRLGILYSVGHNGE